MSAAHLLVTAFVASQALGAHARDDGQFAKVPRHMRDWFKSLAKPRTGVPCCNKADCARTEPRDRGGRWEAKTPDGSWVAIPTESIVTDKGNPTGEPILCSYQEDNGWVVLCFVPGPSG